MMINSNENLQLLQSLVKRAGTQGKAARSLGVDVSTVKRYLNGTLTIPERKAHVMKVVMNLSDDAFAEAVKQ
jgi:DNA-binding transcriptional regulator YdaS (Cro superfamily)